MRVAMSLHLRALPNRPIIFRRASSLAAKALPDGTVYCIGRNYVAHIKELPSLLGLPADLPSSPMIFIKSPATIARYGSKLMIPAWSADVQHEVELAVQLGDDLQPCMAAVAIDLTARDVQAELKRQGHPWALSKSFHASSPFGSMFSLRGVDIGDLELDLEVNGKSRQASSTSLMIFKVPELVAYLKAYFPMRPGDWILTGTPEGVATLKSGDRVTAVLRQGERTLSEGNWVVAVSPTPDAWKQ